MITVIIEYTNCPNDSFSVFRECQRGSDRARLYVVHFINWSSKSTNIFKAVTHTHSYVPIEEWYLHIKKLE